MRRVGTPSRTAALIALGSFAVHQLRFLIVLGGGAGDELERQGHSYLGHVPPTLAAFAFAVIAARLWTAYTGTAKPDAVPSGSVLRRSIAFGLAILSVYIAQEMLESALFVGHAQGLAGVFGEGGWLAVAFAFCLGPLCFLLDRGIGRLEALVAGVAPLESHTPAALLSRPSGHSLYVPAVLSPLAFGLARR